MAEKRKFMRTIGNSVVIKYKVKKGPGEDIECMCSDIGSEGVQIITDKELAIGTSLELKISFGEETDQFFATGEVIWQKKKDIVSKQEKEHYNTGIKFTEISFYGTNKIVRYIYEIRRKKLR